MAGAPFVSSSHCAPQCPSASFAEGEPKESNLRVDVVADTLCGTSLGVAGKACLSPCCSILPQRAYEVAACGVGVIAAQRSMTNDSAFGRSAAAESLHFSR